MHKRMTITLDEEVYDGLYRRIGKRRMSQFIEDLVRPHVVDTALDADTDSEGGYSFSGGLLFS